MNCRSRRSTSGMWSAIVAFVQAPPQLRPEAAHDLVRVVGGHAGHVRARLGRRAILEDDDLDHPAVVVGQLGQQLLEDQLHLDVAGAVADRGLARAALLVVAPELLLVDLALARPVEVGYAALEDR